MFNIDIDIAKKLKTTFLRASEPFRAVPEFIEFQKALPELRATAPKGDGHAVLVLQGFSGPDFSTQPLRSFLDDIGYKTYGWDLKINIGMNEKIAEELRDQLREIFEKHGKVTVIGHSHGGLVARCLADEFPDMVRQVITLGSPFGAGIYKKEVPQWLVKLIHLLSHKRFTLETPGMAERLLTPPRKVWTTSIFSRMDKISGMLATLNPKTRKSQNIEVKGVSHLGLIFSKQVAKFVAELLAMPEDKMTRHPNASDEYSPYNPDWKPAHNANDNWRFFPQFISKLQKKPTSPNNSARRRPGAQPS